GAGTGKTLTLAHRTARLIMDGVPPDRILLLTFTRRSAESLLQRVAKICNESVSNDAEGGARAPAKTKVWGGTFHATGARLLRSQGARIGIDPRFTIHDQSDSEALLEVLRTELRLAEVRKDFPKKGTCQSLHSGWINSGLKLNAFVNASFPWCNQHLDGLRKLFEAYAERKRSQNVFDFDDLLLFWNRLLADPVAGPLIRKRFDCVLVADYQAALPRRPGAHGGRRRCPVDLLVPGGHSSQHPRLPQAVSRRDGRPARGQLPEYLADPRRNQHDHPTDLGRLREGTSGQPRGRTGSPAPRLR